MCLCYHLKNHLFIGICFYLFICLQQEIEEEKEREKGKDWEEKLIVSPVCSNCIVRQMEATILSAMAEYYILFSSR